MKPLVLALTLTLTLTLACDSTKADTKPNVTKADAKVAVPDVKAVPDAKTVPNAKTVPDAEVIDEAKNAVGDPESKAAFEGKTAADDTKAPPADAGASKSYTPIPGPPGPDSENDIDDADREAFEQLAKKPVAPAPATVAEASKQLEAWLNEPAKSPVPALLFAAGDIELAAHCGPCDDHRLMDLYKTTNAAEFGTLVSRIIYSGWTSGGGQKCDERCCTFEDADNAGSGATNIEKICMAVGADGKPTAYTRIQVADQ